VGGSKAAMVGGIVCGAVAAVWLIAHHEDASADDGTSDHTVTARTSSRHGGGGWHLLPWLTGGAPGQPVDAALAESASDIGRYEGKRIPVEVRVVDDEGRPVADADLTVRVDRYEYADVIAAQHPAPTPNADDGYEGSVSAKEWIPADDLPVRNGTVLAQLVPNVTTTFFVQDRSSRRAWSAPMRLAAEDDGSVLNENSSRAYAKGESIVVTLELDEPGAIVGEVFDDHGRPLSGADVTVSRRFSDYEEETAAEDEPENGETPTILSDASGHFRAPVPRSGIYDVSIHAPHFQTTTENAVQVLAGKESRVSITLMPGFEIHGTVVDAHGQPVEGASVMAVAAGGNVARVAYVPPDTQGEFSLEELAPGRYTVRAVGGGSGLQTDVEGIQAGSTGVLVRLREGGHVKGHVFVAHDLLNAPSDAPVEGGAATYLTVYLRTVDDRENSAIEKSGPTIQASVTVPVGFDGNGEVEIPPVPPGRYQVVGQLEQAYSLGPTLYVGEGGTATFDLRLPDASCGPVDGTVRDGRGAAVAGATVYLAANGLGTLQAASDEQGRFHFSSVPPGEYMATANVQLSVEGQGKASVVRYAVANEVVNVGRSARVDLVVRDNDTVTDIIADNSRVELPDDPQGVQPPAGDPVLPDPEPARFVPDVQIQPDDEVGAVVMRAPVGPKGARLFPGDRVQSIDGATFDPSDPYSFLEHLEGAQGTTCTIRVDRPATHESVTVTLPRTVDEDQPVARGEGYRTKMYVE